MQIFSTFEHSIKLELALSTLEQEGIQKECIFAVPLTNRKVERRLFDTMHNSDGVSLVSTGATIGTAFSVVGASVGFSLTWGPIYWGLIGVAVGFLLGVLIDLFINTVVKNRQQLLRGKNPQVIIVVECQDGQADAVENILWNFLASGVARTTCNEHSISS
ncbi:hypothetical protein AN477_08490 [Alicyclobacillus ferrooxydans]|uniref:DUF1269 domain-containing protein n=1 Tax=Alicyclobacillus ferrooxydans TaxID=471514 RepID=A0A0P9CF17_9BACL|nr:hypothetical protein [Alicyclobacillus ferrooxydans]KPV44185.1 hypothetical protein AN477_08490 [Alicyclobacillus ferrooxydans]